MEDQNIPQAPIAPIENQSEPKIKPFSFPKWSLIIIILFLIVALPVGVYLLSKNSNNTISKPTPVDPTANWKTYANKQPLKFSFKYPADLFLKQLPGANQAVFFNSEKDLQEFSNCHTSSKGIFECSAKIVLNIYVGLASTKDYSLEGRGEKIETYKNDQGISWTFFNRQGPTSSIIYESYLTATYKDLVYEMFVSAGNGLSLYTKTNLDRTKVDGGYSRLLQKILSTFKFTN